GDVAGASVAVAVAVAAAVGAAQGLWRRQGRLAWPVGIGALLGIAGLGLAIAIAGQGQEIFALVLILIAFFLVIPALNAVLDVTSWLVSRLLAGDLRRELHERRAAERRALTIAWHTAADLILAVLSMIALAWTLAFLFELYAQYGLAGALPEDSESFVRPMLQDAVLIPGPNAIWIVLMLLSTLVPTAIHMAFLLFAPLAVLSLPGRRRADLIARLEAYDAASDEDKTTTVRKVASYFARERLFVWIAAGATAVLGPLGIALLIDYVTDWHLLRDGGRFLYNVATHGIELALWLSR
ncbi:MAG: hypothetical protein ACFB3T_10535, partial [Geminicoccaceae bacterium]